MINLLLIALVIVLLTILLMPAGIFGSGVEGFLTQKTISANDTPADTQAWLWIERAGTDNNWFYIDRQGVPPTPANVAFGNVAPSTITATGLTALTLDNYGESAIDITIQATDMNGPTTTWTLSDTATQGNSTFGLRAGLSGGDYTIIVKKTAPFNQLVDGLAAATSQSWGMRMYAPTIIPAFEAMSGNITLGISLD